MLQAQYNAALPPSIFGAMSLVSALLCLGLPETANRKLPEDVADCEPGPLLRRLLPRDRWFSYSRRP